MSLILNFDTINNDSTNNDTFDTRFKLIQPLKGVRKIYLKSLELPVNFTNIRNNGTNKLTIQTNGANIYTITLTVKNYTSIDDLLTEINTKFNNVLPVNNTITFTKNTYNKIVITVVSTNASITNYKLIPTNLSDYILGFKNQTFSTLINTSVRDYNLNVDNFINLNIKNLSHQSNNSSGYIQSFKIPLNAVYGTIYYYQENLLYKQYINLSNQSEFLYIDVKLTDRFNENILQNNCDYSFSLEFEFD